jgi:hypothetical protein
MDTIISVCGGLVVLTDGRDQIIRLVHYTAHDYLKKRLAPELPHAPTKITMTCITYLSFQSPRVHEQFSFLDYAVEFCLIHARGEPETGIKQLIMSFLANCSAWRRGWNKKNPNGIPDSASRLWIAAFFQLKEISQYLLQDEGAGTELQEAAALGHINMARILLEIGVDVNATDPKHGTALYAASSWHHTNVVRLLLKHGTNVNARGGYYGTAIIAAAGTGDYDLVQLLLMHGAHVNATGVGRKDLTALYVATAGGHNKIVHLLLKHGADVDARRECGMSEIVQIPSRHIRSNAPETASGSSEFYVGGYRPRSVMQSGRPAHLLFR